MMNHGDSIIDRDPYFEIDSITRQIVNKSVNKTVITQNDHNSERFTFSLPRYVEGHDMLECDSVTVHYRNTSSTSKELTLGIYDITDLKVDETETDYITGTWLLSQNATSLVGSLDFSLHFKCFDDEGNETYAWNTTVSKPITVQISLHNSDTVYEENIDLLQQWHDEVFDIANDAKDNAVNYARAELQPEIEALNAKLDAFINGGATNE